MKDEICAAFSKLVRDGMDDKNITQMELSEISGVSQSAISKILNERLTPGLDSALKILSALKINPGKLGGNHVT